MLYHSASGAPAEVQDALARAHLPTSSAQLMVITGAGALIFGALHGVLSIFASMGRVWPLVTGTACYVLLFGPSLWNPATKPGAHMVSIVMLGTCVSLTVLAAIARNISPPPAQRSA
jgi:hypothetical protein